MGRFKLRSSSYISVLLGVALIVVASGMNSSHINNNMPKICKALKITTQSGSWIANVEFLGIIVTATFASRLGERYGLSKMFSAGSFIFAMCNLLFVFEFIYKNYIAILVVRVVASVGLGTALPLSMPLAMSLIQPEKISTYIAIASVTLPVGTLVSSFLAGLVAETVGWQWMCVAVGVIAGALFVVGLVKLPFKMPVKDDVRFDVPGSALLGAGMVGTVLGLTSLGKGGIMPRWAALVTLAAGLAVLCGFFAYNHRSRNAIFSRELLHKNFLIPACLLLLTSIGYYCERYIDPYVMMSLLKLTPSIAGYWMAGASGALFIFTPIVSKMQKKIVSRISLLIFQVVFTAFELIYALQLFGKISVYGAVICQIFTVGCYAANIILAQSLMYFNTPRTLSAQVGVFIQLQQSSSHSFGITIAVLAQSTFDNGKQSGLSYGSTLLVNSIIVAVTIVLCLLLKVPLSERGKKGFSELKAARNQGDDAAADLVEREKFDGEDYARVDEAMRHFQYFEL